MISMCARQASREPAYGVTNHWRGTGRPWRQTITAFRRETGLPPHVWHLQRKIERVKALLRQGMSPAAAAAETGFADQSHMGRHFAAILGITPAAYARG